MASDSNTDNYIQGRGAQINSRNKFLKQSFSQEHIEGIDEPFEFEKKTEYLIEHPKKMINKIVSPDIPGFYSMNAYQGCEHGCIYCYARNTHEYYGYSAGHDFEQKIIVKLNAAKILETEFEKKSYKPSAIMLSGNTDCYQPAERKYQLTRSLLEVCLRYKNPVSMITKNQLILRDLDLLTELASMNLVHVMMSITSLKEKLRQKMEPRTATIANRLKVVETLRQNNIEAGVMMAPIVPGINSDEIPEVVKAAANAGAIQMGMTMVRLNGSIAQIFTDWLRKNFPDRAEKVIHQIQDVHGGQLNDSKFGRRMKGEGHIASGIHSLFKLSVKKYLGERKFSEYNTALFERPERGQLHLKF